MDRDRAMWRACEQMGLDKWIDQQLDPDSIDDSALDQRLEKYPTLKMSSQQLLEDFPPPAQAAKKEGETKEEYKQQMQEKRRDAMSDAADTGNENVDKAQQALAKMQGPGRIVAELSMAKVDRAVYSNRQLEAVMEDFWFNHFNVFAGKGADRWLLTSYVRDTIRPHTMGKFQDLLIATAKSPAMLFFLDNWLSVDPAAFKEHQQEMAERRARYQGAFGGEFRPFGPPQMAAAEVAAQQRPKQQEDRGLNENYGREVMELHTVGVDAGYTQQDVIEMAECLTGWTVQRAAARSRILLPTGISRRGQESRDGPHVQLRRRERRRRSARRCWPTIRTRRNSFPPNWRGILCRILRRRRLWSGWRRATNRPAAIFAAVLKTMIYSPEFWSKETYRAKVKTPFELVASTARALDADVSVSLPLAMWVGRMGEPLFLCQPPTGYSDKATTWVNTGALLNRLNFALAFATNHMAGANVDLPDMFGEDASKDPEMALSRALRSFPRRAGGADDACKRSKPG